MKQIAPNYTYNKTTGVITLTGVNIDRDQLLLIVNTTRNVTYYNFADSATTLQAFTQGANTSITLATSVVSASSTHNNADALTIYYDDQAIPLQMAYGDEAFETGNRLAVSIVNSEGQEYTTPLPVSVKSVPPITATGANHPVTSFTVSTKTITIANFPSAPVVGNFLLITNTKLGVIVHNSADPQKICTFGSPTYNGQFYSIIATFPDSVDTGGMNNSDTFHVVYAPVAIGYPLASQVELVGRTQSGGTSKAEMSAGISGALLVDTSTGSLLGATSESAATTDTASSGINGLLKRLLQRITTLIYPPFASGSFTNSGGASTGIDCGGYDYLVQHISGGGGGYNRPINWSYDNVNWTQGGVVFRHISGGSSSTGNDAHWTVMGDILGTSSGIFVIPVVGRYFRIGASGINGGGSWTHNWYLHKGPFPGIVEEGIGARSSTAATTDTADVGLNGLFKRLLQRLTTLLPANLTVSSTRLLVDGSGVTQPVSIASVPSHAVTGPLTNTELRATAVPISGTVTANTGLTQPLTDTQLRATAVSVSTIPAQGTTVTSTGFASIVSNQQGFTLVSASAGRRVLTVFNEGTGVLYISAGATCNTTTYQVRLGAGDYWEAPEGQLSLAHTAVFGTIGSAKVIQVT